MGLNLSGPDAARTHIQQQFAKGEISASDAYAQLVKLAELETAVPGIYQATAGSVSLAGGIVTSGLAAGSALNAGAVRDKVYHPEQLPGWAVHQPTKRITSAGYLFLRLQRQAQAGGVKTFNLREKPCEGGLFAFPGLTIMSVGEVKDKVVVFIIYKSETPMVLEDDLILFPSDGLLTRLQTLVESSGK